MDLEHVGVTRVISLGREPVRPGRGAGPGGDPGAGPTAVTDALLERIATALERLAAAAEARIADSAPPRATVVLRPGEVDAINQIVDAAWERFGGAIWSVAEVTAGAPDDSHTFRANLGRLLGRAVKAEHVAAGFRVECAGAVHGAKLWRLRATG